MSARILLFLLISALVARAQVLPATFSLTEVFEADLATQEWSLVKGAPPPHWHPPGITEAWPLHLVLINAATGARSPLKPAAYFVTGDRHRWGGRTLGVDWVLVLDGCSNQHLRVSGQFKSATAQVLALEVGVQLDLDGWSWHDGPWHTVPLAPDLPPRLDAQPGPLGPAGLQARSPLSVISQADQSLVLEAGHPEPLSFHTLADPRSGWWGAHLNLATDPRTEKFPGRAAFRLDLRHRPIGGATAFRSAGQDYAQRGETARTWHMADEGLQVAEAAFSAADVPPIYRRGEYRPGFAQAVPLELDASGWQPDHRWTVREPGTHVDAFGSITALVRRLVISSASSWPHLVHLEAPPMDETLWMADPATGSLEFLGSTTGTVSALWLEPGQPVTREIFAASALDEVRDYYRSEAPDTEGIHTLVDNLDTLSKLHALEVGLDVRMEHSARTGRDHPVTLAVSNRGPTALTLTRAELLGTDAAQALLTAPLTLPPGGHTECSGFLDPATLQTPHTRVHFAWSMERQGASAEATWTDDLTVYPPLWAQLPTSAVVTLEEQLVLPVPIWNRTDTPRAVLLSGRGDFAVTPVSLQLDPGQQRVVELTVAAGATRRGRLQLEVANADQVCAGQTIQVEFLDPGASLARDDRVSVETSGTEAGTSTRALRDGDQASTWQADPAVVEPWVRVGFPEPTAISEVLLVWPPDATAQRGHLRGLTAAGEDLHLAAFSNAPGAAETRILIGDVHLRSLTVHQPAGGGPPHQPNVLWLNELEVR